MRCKSCQAEIIWVLTDSGRRMPLDAVPVPTGNVVIRKVTGAGTFHATVLGPGDQLDPAQDDGQRYVSHFVTCPEAHEHRKR